MMILRIAYLEKGASMKRPVFILLSLCLLNFSLRSETHAVLDADIVAQAAEKDTTLKIDEFIRENSPTLRAKMLEVEYAHHAAWKQLLGYTPHISTNFAWQARSACSCFSIPSQSYTATVNQPLIQGFGPIQLYNQSMYTYRSAQHMYDDAENDILFQTRSNDIGYTIQQSQLMYMQALNDALQLKAQSTTVGFDAGTTSYVERDTARAAAREQQTRTLLPSREQTSIVQKLSALAAQPLPYIPA